jgi:uncharacterized membrane protein
MKTKKTAHFTPHMQRYLLTGILTVIPIWITWLVFEFVFKQLSHMGMPWVRALSRGLRQTSPALAEWLMATWFHSALAVVLTLLALYLLGWITTLVIGKRLIGLLDWFMNRIPLVQTIYGGVKKLLTALQQKPDRVQRVVLIPFPTPEMKTVGFVTRILRDYQTGKELAAVYVPTTPNPTSGYLEIVPLDKLVSTDWSIDEAMTFIISGGAVAPDKIHYYDREKE